MDFYQQNPYMTLPGVTAEELAFLQQATAELSENQKKNFFMIYTGKRKSPQDILIFTLIGFFGVAGIQRFLVGQTFLGIVYLLTVGFCGIGTIIDLINHKDIATEYNRKMAYESFQFAKAGSN